MHNDYSKEELVEIAEQRKDNMPKDIYQELEIMRSKERGKK